MKKQDSIDVVGSAFGIWHNDVPGPIQESSLLRPGNEQVAASYIVYGTSTVQVAATRESVQGFTLDNASGEFMLTHPDLRYPKKCEYYSANVGNFGDWRKPVQRAVTALRGQYTLRYIGSLVCDFHRNLLNGGIYLYPGDTTNVHGNLANVRG